MKLKLGSQFLLETIEEAAYIYRFISDILRSAVCMKKHKG
jgi:hypothetical protein